MPPNTNIPVIRRLAETALLLAAAALIVAAIAVAGMLATFPPELGEMMR